MNGIVLDEQTLSVWQKTGTPSETVTVVRNLLAEEDHIRDQQWMREKEKAEIGKTHQRAAEALAKQVVRAEHEAAAERDRELAAVDAEIARARSVPGRGMSETDAEYSARLTRTHIDETRRNSALVEASIDIAVALQSTDPKSLALMVTDTIAASRPEAISRVGRAVEARLQFLAGEAQKGGGVDSSALAALLEVQDGLRAWRAAESAGSPTVKRQRINERYLGRVQDINRVIGTAAEKIGLSKAVAAETARLQM